MNQQQKSKWVCGSLAALAGATTLTGVAQAGDAFAGSGGYTASSHSSGSSAYGGGSYGGGKSGLGATGAGAGSYAGAKGSALAGAGADSVAAPVEEDTIFDTIWGLPTFYSNKENPVIQHFGLIGRFQWQHAEVRSSQGDADRDEIRRFRIGPKIKFGKRFELKGEANLDADGDGDFYKSIDSVSLKYKINDSYSLSVGKMKPKFSYEYATSSKEILTFERSLLVNQLISDKTTGISLSGKANGFSFTLAGYAADSQDEFSEFDAGSQILASIGYDFKDATGLDASKWRLDYQHSTSADNTTLDYQNSFSTSFYFQNGPFGLITDVLYGTGFKEDAFGVVVMPTYDITDQLQLVARYQFANSSNDGLRTQKRYEREAPDLTDGGRGDQYHAGYVGLNYYIYGHKLKLMTGIEYASMSGGRDGGDFDGWTWFSGVRLHF